MMETIITTPFHSVEVTPTGVWPTRWQWTVTYYDEDWRYVRSMRGQALTRKRAHRRAEYAMANHDYTDTRV